MKKIIISVIVIAASLVAIGFVLTKNKAENEAKTAIVAEKNATVAVKTAVVKTEIVSSSFSVNGTLIPSQELNFASENAGRVTKVLVDEGSQVRVGQVLAIIKADKINVDVQNAQAAYQTALADVKRFESAYATGGVTQQQLEQMKLNLMNAKSRYEQTKITFGDATVRATINGIVNKRMIEPGSYVSPGTALFEIVNVAQLKLKVSITESQLADVKLGQSVSVSSSVFPDKNFSGKVSFMAPKADTNLNFPLEITINNAAGANLKAGMYATANFEGSSSKSAITIVPRTAFVGSVSSNQIFVVENGIAQLKTVKSGRIFGDKVEILSGLNNNQQVVITGQINLTNGTKVSVIQ